jgi:hypothetical protein
LKYISCIYEKILMKLIKIIRKSKWQMREGIRKSNRMGDYDQGKLCACTEMSQ